MIAPPAFETIQEYGAHLGDLRFWWPYVAQILERHGLAKVGPQPVAGAGGTYPTVLYGDVVVKLFGYFRTWREGHAAERAALALVATDPEIAAPELLFEGWLYDDADAPWPYLITTWLSGVAWRDAQLTVDERLSVVAGLGRQVRRVHALRSSDIAPHEAWSPLNASAATARHRAWGSLPPHLLDQVGDYLAQLGPFDRVVVHADLTADHAFVEHGRLTGIIDWGDAMVTDRHYELGALHIDMFRGDKALLKVFLEACGWPVGEDFPRRAMALALHHRFDVFEAVGALLPLREVGTLDALATELFAV